jgi:GntR family transcriptional regulator / MocR family aminotransferase
VVDAYAQLAGEGYLELRPGARPRVTGCAGPCETPATARPAPATEPKYDFRPGVPDLSSFPRTAWLRSLREALFTMRDADLGYTDPQGTEVLRLALRDYLGRVRGVVSDAGRVVITSGYCQGRSLVCRALLALGARRVAVEDPCHDEVRNSVVGAGLTLVPVPVDADGMRVEGLDEAKADAVIITPAHQYPTGAVLSGQRRGALLEWLRRTGGYAIEDDYDAEYRYDRAPVGALQAMDPEHIVYAGTTSKTLAPALRIGWLVVPARLLAAVQQHQRQMDFGVSRIDQHAFADFLGRGELDRHLRRMRVRYRARRDTLVEALTDALPEVRVHGSAPGSTSRCSSGTPTRPGRFGRRRSAAAWRSPRWATTTSTGPRIHPCCCSATVGSLRQAFGLPSASWRRQCVRSGGRTASEPLRPCARAPYFLLNVSSQFSATISSLC